MSLKTIHKKFICALLALCLVVAASPADARRAKKSAYNPPYAGFVMDAGTGQILYSDNADRPLHPASLTKIMTLLMVFEALERGEISMRDRVVMSRRAASMSPSKLGLNPGASLTVKDAIYAVVTKSCNDVAVALAERLGGSESAFARRMTLRARELGMTSSTFTNASGLPSPNQFSSARDMARLARYVITAYPEYYKFYNAKEFRYAGQTLQSHNKLMKTYAGMDGMKTGYIYASGYNLVASAVRGNNRLIGVVFGGKTSASRNQHMARLLDDGFNKLNGQSKGNAVLVVDSGPGLKEPPVPGKKPGVLLAAATLNNLAPVAAQASATARSFLAAAPASIEPAAGPASGGVTNAVLTRPGDDASLIQASLPAWAIQIGAFSSRAATDKALNASLKKLPVKYASVNPMIAPLKTPDGDWVFRARLHGFSRNDAFSACKYLRHCVPVAPRNE